MSDVKPHLSVSQLSTLQKCGEMYRWRYIEGIKSPPGVALVIGKGTHAAIEQDLGNKMTWGELLPDDSIADYASDATKTAWDSDQPVLADGDPSQGEAVDTRV